MLPDYGTPISAELSTTGTDDVALALTLASEYYAGSNGSDVFTVRSVTKRADEYLAWLDKTRSSRNQ